MLQETNESFYDATGQRVSNTSQLKLFSILKDIETNERMINVFNVYNVNESLIGGVFYDIHEVDDGDWWDNISYKYYNTPYLWWLIAAVNNIINPFEELEEGLELKILKPPYVYQALKDVKNIGNI